MPCFIFMWICKATFVFFFEGVPYQTHHGLEASFSSFYSPKWLGTTGWERSGDKETIKNMYFYTNSLEVKPRFFKRPVKRPSIFQVRGVSSSRSMKWWQWLPGNWYFQDSLAPTMTNSWPVLTWKATASEPPASGRSCQNWRGETTGNAVGSFNFHQFSMFFWLFRGWDDASMKLRRLVSSCFIYPWHSSINSKKDGFLVGPESQPGRKLVLRVQVSVLSSISIQERQFLEQHFTTPTET